jgi:DNA polymerase-3 subunit gamma/tau
MAYQVLARKWRPQDFESIVGQEPVVTALQNALSDGRVAQAYLFSGIRGVGKTSVARVFAKALNCENEPPSDPCNDCTSCEEIAAGADLDVLEIDAATYSKVEQVRELTESLRYGPARDKYKVVIIDEIHRLSRQAFDALLKIVEEPPAHLVFMFATTEIEAVPATILSRCQSFQLRRVPLIQMVEHLARISEAEGLGASDHALRLIARAGEGSVRDSVALLDQIATFGGGQVADDEVSRILGGADLAVYQGLLHSILAGESQEVSTAVRQIEASGLDPRHVYGEFLVYCRDALHLALDPDIAAVELPSDEAAALAHEASAAGYENLLRLVNLLLESEMGVRRSESASLALEIALLRAAELPKLVAIEEILAGGAPPVSESAAGGGERGRSSSTPKKQAKPRPPRQAVQPTPEAPPQPPAEPEPMEASGPEPPAEVEPPPIENDPAFAEPADPEPAKVAPPKPPPGSSKLVNQLMERVSYLKQPLAAHLSGAESLTVEDDVLVIATAPGDSVLERTLTRASNRDVLDQTLAEMLGSSARWRLTAGSGEALDAADRADDIEPDEDVTRDPTVQTVLDLFGGKIESVEQHPNPQEN